MTPARYMVASASGSAGVAAVAGGANLWRWTMAVTEPAGREARVRCLRLGGGHTLTRVYLSALLGMAGVTLLVGCATVASSVRS